MARLGALKFVSLHLMQKKYGAIAGRQTPYATLEIDAVKRCLQSWIERSKFHGRRTTGFVRVERLIKGHGRQRLSG
jgi:hypothetical protein